MADSTLDPLQLLQEDLKDDDFALAMRSVNRLATIGLALGPARTRSQLIPYLMEYAEEDNDEAHCAIARQLGDFVDLVGGANTAHVACLLPLLEKFCGEEETVIREVGCASMKKVMPALLVEHRASQLFPLIRRLAEGDWFTARSSACILTVQAYPLLRSNSDLQQQMRTWYAALCRDDTPMVKKSALKNLGDFSVAVDGKHFVNELLPIVREGAQNDMDNLRLYTVDSCTAVAKVLSGDEFKTYIVPLIEGCEDDMSWRVRMRLAEQMPIMMHDMRDSTVNTSAILPVFAKLLVDREAEVRIKAVSHLVEVALELKGQSALVEHIGPAVEVLTNDAENSVRRAFALTLVPLCNAFPRDAGAKLLVPLMQQLTQDDFYIVRHNVVSKLHELDSGPNGILMSLVPQLMEMAKDGKWRVRMTVIEKVSLLAECLGRAQFERKLQGLLIACLSDHVSAIREIACKQCAKVVALYGATWAQKSFFNDAFSLYDQSTNYLHRMTCLMFIGNCAEESKVTGEVYVNTFLPILQQAFVDEVANVRLMAAQTLFKVIPHLPTNVLSTIQPALEVLTKDADSDVSYFSSLCSTTPA